MEKSQSTLETLLTTLPVEIFHHIFSWLPLSFVIANCSLVSRHFYRISRNLSWVTELNLSTFYKINDNVLENLFRTQFQKNNHLKVLNLAYCVHITDASLKLIAEYFPSLQELDLSHCRSITVRALFSEYVLSFNDMRIFTLFLFSVTWFGGDQQFAVQTDEVVFEANIKKSPTGFGREDDFSFGLCTEA
jgi:hypothetical protein